MSLMTAVNPEVEEKRTEDSAAIQLSPRK